MASSALLAVNEERQNAYLGLDPGLLRTGWGILEVIGNRLTHLGHGVIVPAATLDLPNWLLAPHSGVESVLFEWLPEEVAVEETFSNVNADSTIKLGHARGVILVGQSSGRAG